MNAEELYGFKLMETKQIPLSFIKDEETFYPRFKYDEKAVNRLRNNIEALPAIKVTEDGILIDGKHRLVAFRIEQLKEITAEIISIPKENIYAYAAYLMSITGVPGTEEEKKSQAIRIYRENHWSDEQIGFSVGVSKETVPRYLSELKKDEKQQQKEKAWRLWMKCYTEDQIAEEVAKMGYGTVDPSTISRWISNLQKLHLQEMQELSSLKLYTIWNFPKLDKDQLKYPGQLPEELMENVLYYWTEPGQIVWDPFAGSGTTGKVAERMMRRYQLSDLAPIDSSIKQHDILVGIPDGLMKPDLIFLDPPYWNQVSEKYTDHPSNIARMKMDEFYQAFEKILKSFTKFKGSKVALIIGDTREDFHTEFHLHKILNITDGLGWQLVDRVIVPYSTQQTSAAEVETAKKTKTILRTHRDLVVLGIGE